jgi:hypothetical protein
VSALRCHSLRCHPAMPARGVTGIAAGVERTRAGLQASYVWTGDLGRVRVPEPRTARFTDGLWRHSCCELFLARQDERGYREYNFSHSGEWAAYTFAGYREGQTPLAGTPRIEVSAQPHALRLQALVEAPAGALLIGLSAVVEADDGTLSYWALVHPPGRPDFHHRASLALELA